MFKSAHGTLLVARAGGSVSTDSKPLHSGHKFIVKCPRRGVVALQSLETGRWLCCEPGGRVVCDRGAIGAWEQWEVADGFTPGTVSLRSPHGRFLCVESLGAVIADRGECREWESLTLMKARTARSILPEAFAAITEMQRHEVLLRGSLAAQLLDLFHAYSVRSHD